MEEGLVVGMVDVEEVEEEEHREVKTTKVQVEQEDPLETAVEMVDVAVMVVDGQPEVVGEDGLVVM